MLAMAPLLLRIPVLLDVLASVLGPAQVLGPEALALIGMDGPETEALAWMEGPGVLLLGPAVDLRAGVAAGAGAEEESLTGPVGMRMGQDPQVEAEVLLVRRKSARVVPAGLLVGE